MFLPLHFYLLILIGSERAEIERERAETERERAEVAENAQRDAIPRLLGLGLSIEQIAEALSLPIEEVRSRMQ